MFVENVREERIREIVSVSLSERQLEAAARSGAAWVAAFIATNFERKTRETIVAVNVPPRQECRVLPLGDTRREGGREREKNMERLHKIFSARLRDKY